MKTTKKKLRLWQTICLMVSLSTLMTSAVLAKSTDIGVCFLKTDKQTVQSKINEISQTNQEKIIIQQNVRFFNDLSNLFVPVDTFNFKMFWVSRPNNDWLTQNCFKFGYIALKDYNRRAITRVYSTPTEIAEETKAGSRMPSSIKEAIPQADPPAKEISKESVLTTPFDPQSLQAQKPAEAAPQNSQVPQIHLYNYYGGAQGNTNAQPSNQDQRTENINSKKEDNLNVNVNVGDSSKDSNGDENNQNLLRRRSVYDLPNYLEEPSYFFELSPLMGYENIEVLGVGGTNKFNLFGYGTDLKLGYRFNQHFNYYFKGRYMALELRAVEAPASANLSTKSDITYGFGIEHVASRFLSLALEYNALNIQAFQETGTPNVIESITENIQTVNLDFKLNFISRDNFKLGLHGNYGVVLADNSDELIYDFKTKIYVLRAFEKDYFGFNLGYEQNKFLYATGNTVETTRKRFVFGLNFGFEL